LRFQTRFGRYRWRRVPFSCFAPSNSFWAVQRAPSPFLCFVHPDSFSTVSSASSPIFHVLRSRTNFRRYRGRWDAFSCFMPPYSFSTIPRASGPVFMFCAPEPVLRGTEGAGSSFLCFVLPDSFWAVPRAPGPVVIFCATRLIFGGTEGVRSRYHVLHSRVCFRWYRGHRVPFSCFALSDSFLTVPRASGPVFIFCALELILGGTEGVGSNFHILCSQTRFVRYRGRRVQFSCIALPNPFWAVTRTSGPVCMCCAPELVLVGTRGAGSHFHVMGHQTHFRRFQGCRIWFSCFAFFDSFSTVTRVLHHIFHVLRSRTHFRQYRGCRVPISCFVLPNSFWVVTRATSPIRMFCAPGLVFDCTECVKSGFHFLRSRTHFQR
jgi:hypothetical protein